MISRRTAAAVGDAFQDEFCFLGGDHYSPKVYRDLLYDFLFECGYQAWFCNSVKTLPRPREVKEHFMQLHTGETQAQVTKTWDWAAREKLGQQYLCDLAKDMLIRYGNGTAKVQYSKHTNTKTAQQALRESLELDGYVYRDSRLLTPESDILDTQEEGGVLANLFNELQLNNWPTAKHCLDLSEEHWLNNKWDDCISNARRFMECILQESAAAHSLRIKGTSLASSAFERPVEVRKYLEHENLLESRETKAIAEVYGLLSNVGSHPRIARKDQARLWRQIALIFSHFVMLLSPA